MYRKAKAVRAKRVGRRNVVLAAIAIFVVTFTAFYVHKVMNNKSEAETPITRGYVNNLSDFQKDMTFDSASNTYKRNLTYESTLGEKGKNNPFLVLEVVPNVNMGYFGYLIDGCQPLDIKANYINYANAGSPDSNPIQANFNHFPSEYTYVDKCFVDEHEYEAANYANLDSTQVNCYYYTKDWTLKNDSLTAIGYYEYVGEGKGSFNYTGKNVADSSGVSGSGTVYRPTFEDVGFGKGSFMWVTLKTGTDNIKGSKYYQMFSTSKNYNKTASSETDKMSFKIGDREYTSRTSSTYYKEVMGWTNYVCYYQYVGDGNGQYAVTEKSQDVWDGSLGKNVKRYSYEFNDVGAGKGAFNRVVAAAETTDVDSVFPKNNRVPIGNGCVLVNKEDGRYFAKLSSSWDAGFDSSISFKDGDRYYTSAAGNIYTPRKPVCSNSFFTSCLELMGRKAIEDYEIVYKIIEPWELTENPEWLDRADFIYMHNSDETSVFGSGGGNVGEFASNGIYSKVDKSTIRMDMSKSKTYPGAPFGYCASGKNYKEGYDFSKIQNDFSFDVARRMFLKCNALGEYAEDENHYLNYAPVILNATLYEGGSDYEQKSVEFKMLDYSTLDESTHADSKLNNETAYNNNVYKFCIMQNLMSAENFYKYFMVKNKKSDGLPVIKMSADGSTGYCTSHDSHGNSEYWNIHTFLPDDLSLGKWSGGTNGSGIEVPNFIDLYGLNPEMLYLGGAGSGNTALFNQSSFIYNSNDIITVLFGSDAVDPNSVTGGADVLDFFNSEDAEDSNYDNIGQLPISRLVEYLLQYRRKSNTEDGENEKDIVLKILEVEPCNDFILTEDFIQTYYLPPSTFKGKYSFTRMTTAEFNTVKDDLAADYDIVYIGVEKNKFNLRKNGNLWFNDTDNLKGTAYRYIHVGDTYNNGGDTDYRASGNDISGLMLSRLINYSKSNKLLIFGLTDYPYYNIEGKDLYTDYADYCDSSSNMYTLVGNNAVRKKSIKFSALRADVVIDNIKAFASTPVKLTKQPVSYNNEDATSTLNGSKLNFSFTCDAGNFKTLDTSNKEIDNFSVSLYVDVNNNGVIDTLDNANDLVYNSGDVAYVPAPDSITVSGGSVSEAGLYVWKNGGAGDLSFDLSTLEEQNIKVGVLRWKLVFKNNANGGLYDFDGSTYLGENSYKSIVGEKPDDNVIHALQIVDNSNTSAAAGNLQKALEDESSLFYAKTLGSATFKNWFSDITVDTITVDQYIENFLATEPTAGSEDAIKGYQSYYYGFDYLTAEEDRDKSIFYYPVEANTSTGVRNLNITDFTHDHDYNMIIVSASTDAFDSARSGNEYRVDSAVAYLNFMSDRGAGIVYTGKAVGDSTDTAYYQIFKNSLNLSRFTDKSDGVDTDSAYLSGESVGASTLNERTYGKIAELASAANKYKMYNNTNWKVEFEKDMDKATMVSRTNSGNITSYPYAIDKNVPIQGKTAENFQLNMENKEVEVWYCLAGDTYSSADTKVDKDFYDVGYDSEAEWTHSEYGVSPNDGTNNYYLYSYQSTIYSGIDTSKLGSVNEGEMELFINTLCATLDSIYTEPYVDLLKAEKIDPADAKDMRLEVMKNVTLKNVTADASVGTGPSIVKGYALKIGGKLNYKIKDTYNYRHYVQTDDESENKIVDYTENRIQSVDTEVEEEQVEVDNEVEVESDEEDPIKAEKFNVTSLFNKTYDIEVGGDNYTYTAAAALATQLKTADEVYADIGTVFANNNKNKSVDKADLSKGFDNFALTKIYFSPFDSYFSDGTITNFKVSLTKVDEDEALSGVIDEIGTSEPIDEIFQKIKYKKKGTSDVTDKYYRYDSNDAHRFRVSTDNYLTSNNNYFVMINPGYIAAHKAGYNALKFEIWNKKAYSVSYMYITEREEESEDDAQEGDTTDFFLFDLD